MRNLGLIVALWLAAFLPTNSLALGLGQIEVNSFLNQPLNAEIEVISARPGEIDDLLVSLASREAFTRAGLSRPQHLSDLRFAVRKNEAGDEAVIVVSTKSAVKEPFLNFLIEADWSKGRVLREFTILLDPPFYADQPPAPETASQPVEQSVPEQASVSEIVEQTGVTPIAATEPGAATETYEAAEQITEPIALVEEPVQPEPITESYGTEQPQNIIEGDVLVVKGDTLWSIASRYKDRDHSMAQVMLAFQRANPGAFTNGNINNMKEGAILRAPSELELDAYSAQDAYAEVLVQNGLWDEYVARVTGVSRAVASDRSGTETATSATDTSSTTDTSDEGTGELSLLLPSEGGSESAGTGETGGEVDELRTKLALAEEELEASRIENLELESRIAELQARLSKVEELQKMVEIEDDSLAQMQVQQAEAEATEGIEEMQEPDVATETVSEAIQADEEALLEELLAEEAAAQAEEQAVIAEPSSDEMVSDEPVTEEAVSSEDVMTDDRMSDDLVAGEVTTEPAQADEVAPPPAPVIMTEPVAHEPSIFDGILPPDIIEMIPSMPAMGGLFSDPIILAAIGGVVILLIILVWFKRRQASSDDESGITVSGDDDLFADEEEELTPIHLADAAQPDETDIKIPTQEDLAEPLEEVAEPMDDMAATAIISATDMPEPEAPAPAAASSEQDDVLNEVDVYLAYGLYDNAEELLNSNLAEHPERADYRSKLLDTYFATKNVDAFVGEAEKLKSMGDAGSRYWDRVQVMGYELVPDNPLFSAAKDIGISAADLEITKPQEADFDLGASEDDDTNFSTTDFNLGEEDTGSDFSDTSNLGEAGSIAATQQIPQLDELPDIGDEDDTDLRAKAGSREDTRLELPEEIGEELEFSIDEPASGDADLELPDDLDLGTDEPTAVANAAAGTDLDDLSMEFDAGDSEADAAEDISEIDFGAEFESALEDGGELDIDDSEMISFEADMDEDALELGVPADQVQEKTAIITPNYEATEVVPKMDGGDSGDESEIDLGMEDTAMLDSDDTSLETGELNLDTRELRLPTDDLDDDEDISIIDFGGEDFVEPTDVIESIDDDDSLAMDDDDGDDVKTGTFAPGDFEEPTAKTAAVGDIDDIGDLMLPDDVDEVSTKLDLARAFIDMGDTEGARGSLEEVMSEGNAEQKAEAKALLAQI